MPSHAAAAQLRSAGLHSLLKTLLMVIASCWEGEAWKLEQTEGRHAEPLQHVWEEAENHTARGGPQRF